MTYIFHIEYPNIQVDMNIENLVDYEDHCDKYHMYMDSLLHKYQLLL